VCYITNINCTFSQNRAIGGVGGAGGKNNNLSSVPGGTGGAGDQATGGALSGFHAYNFNCTFSGNSATGGGGGAGGDSDLSRPGGTGGSGADGIGGAIYVFVGNFFGCTIISNSAFAGTAGLGGSGVPPGATGASGKGNAGGVYGYILGGCLNDIGNTILADNYADTSCSNFLMNFNDLGYNFIGSDDHVIPCPFGGTTIIGTIATPIHPQLKPLAQNGGGLPTHATTPASPVTDQGSSFGLTTDERGAPRPYDFNTIPNASGGDGSDIGAFELGNPDLGGGQGGNKILLTWPAYYGDFTVQSTSNLLAPGSWSSVTDLPVIIGSVFVISNNPVGANGFYRLKSP